MIDNAKNYALWLKQQAIKNNIIKIKKVIPTETLYRKHRCIKSY